MFSTVRLLAAACLLLVGWLIIRRFCKRRKLWITGWIICISVLILLSCFFPPEQHLITFSTIDTAYSYANTGAVLFSVSGCDSDFVLGKRSAASYTTVILPRESDGWRFGNVATTDLVYLDVFDSGSISVYHSPKSKDYYIYILVTSLLNPAVVRDSNSSVFRSVDDDAAEIYVTAVSAPDENYTVFVNDIPIHPFS